MWLPFQVLSSSFPFRQICVPQYMWAVKVSTIFLSPARARILVKCLFCFVLPAVLYTVSAVVCLEGNTNNKFTNVVEFSLPATSPYLTDSSLKQPDKAPPPPPPLLTYMPIAKPHIDIFIMTMIAKLYELTSFGRFKAKLTVQICQCFQFLEFPCRHRRSCHVRFWCRPC